MKKILLKLKKISLNNLIEKRSFSYILIFLFSGFLVYPYLFGNFHLGDDASFHMASFHEYAADLPFSIFAKIMPEIANGMGYGSGIFYPALPHIIGGIIFKMISVFGLGLVASEKIIHFLIFLFSGITMFWLGEKVFNDNKKAIISSLFYITYNYMFVDVIVRDALNESFMFIFMPLVFLGLYNLFVLKDTKKFYIYFIIGYIGLMYSHLVMTVYFTMFLIVFLLLFVKNIFNKKTFIPLLLASLFILIFTSTFTVLMIEHKIFGDYLVFEKRIWTEESIWNMPLAGYFVEHYFGTYNDGLIYSNLNFLMIIFLILTLFKIFKGKVDVSRKKFIVGLFIFGVLGILLNTFTSIWLHVPSLFLSIQFVWRLSIFVGFGLSLVCAESLDVYLNLFKSKYIWVAFSILLIIFGVFVFNNNQKLVFQENISIESETPREYFPTDTYKKYFDYFENRDSQEIIVLEGNAKVKLLENDVPYMEFKVSDIKNNIKIELPRIYYLGYKITDEDGNALNYKENKYGFITLEISKNGKYEVEYVGTIAYKISIFIKAITIVLLFVYCIYRYRKKKGRKENEV